MSLAVTPSVLLVMCFSKQQQQARKQGQDCVGLAQVAQQLVMQFEHPSATFLILLTPCLCHPVCGWCARCPW
jgi:hypothetical protein